MFSRALIATDSSPASTAVVGRGEALRQLGVRECVLAQCFSIHEHVAFPNQIKAHIESTLSQQKEILEQQGIRTTIVVESGLAGIEIPRIAKERDCSLIVAGSHGHNFTSEVLLGETAGELIHRATKPLLIVRLTRNEDAGRIECTGEGCDFRRHILFPTDFSDHAKCAFSCVRELVRRGAPCVTLLHVQSKAGLGKHLADRLEEFNRIDRERLEKLRDRLMEEGDVDVELNIPYGSPSEEILKHSGKDSASLVVMGTHGRGFVSELFLGSVSHNVARHSMAPVLLIPVNERTDILSDMG
ncbi:MAG: universal stress protein [Lentisphaeria bacterium]|nr:universal stress protein [Lentisphaeria bacterium]